jgi:hypothetical protein
MTTGEGELSKRAILAVTFVAALAAFMVVQGAGAKTDAKSAPAAASGCQLNSAKGNIKHVIYIQFDNTHLLRDNPNVPSDLQQMPHLLNFLESNGTVINKHHTILISHTAGGILTSLTGLYPDRNGTTVSNSYDYYRPDPKTGVYSGTFTTAFKYWTAPVSSPLDPKPNMVNGDSGTAKNTPAPWVSYTRAGCDFGAVSVANTVLENTGTSAANGDIYEVFGPGSPEYVKTTDAAKLPNDAANAKARAKPQADYVGIAVHCGAGGGICNTPGSGARPDKLPDEPGGYSGYQALFGATYVDPAIAGSPTVNDINGNPITDPRGNPGFPGFDGMPAAVTLGYVAQMQEAGIPVTYAYISDAHDNHAGFGAYGPGEAGYVAALKSYDDAFGKFFDRLAADGINKSNTLFVFTADEGDHYAGQQAQNCDGVSTPCVYNANTTPGGKPAHGIIDLTNGASANSATWTPPAWPPASQNGPLVGEVGMDLKWLFGPMPAGYDTSFDSAPSFYIDGQPQAVDASGHVALNSTLRAFEQRAASVKAFDPYINTTQFVPVANYLVDAPTLKALHMINADPQRTMSFTMFSKPDFYFQTFSPCPSPQKACVNAGFAYIHGDYAPDIGQTWLGMVGPGIKNEGVDNRTWSDHSDIAPTMLALLGLKTDYQPDGRVISEPLSGWAVKGDSGESMGDLGTVYKQVNAPYGDFAHSLIVASTKGISSSDSVYLDMEQKIQDLTTARDALVTQMKAALNGTGGSDGNHGWDDGNAKRLIREGMRLLAQARALAAS